MKRILSGFLLLYITISTSLQTGGGFNIEQNDIGNLADLAAGNT